MFEPGFDQAAGLRAEVPAGSACLVPVASPAQPARAFEWLCTLAGALAAQGRAVVIVDATARESGAQEPRVGAHLGLLRALQDPSIANLERATDGADWLVMPGSCLSVSPMPVSFKCAGISHNAITSLILRACSSTSSRAVVSFGIYINVIWVT